MGEAEAHHRFRLLGQAGGTALSAEAALAAPWTVLFGASGTGKTTLLRALAGLVPLPGATFERRSTPTGLWTDLASLRPDKRHIAYHPQAAPLLPHLSAGENIRFPEVVRHVPASRSMVPALADLLRITPLLAKRPARLSGGERQRVSLARALAVPDARLLLLDEPFAGLDRGTRDAIVADLRMHLARRGLPVLSVTHDPDETLLLHAEVLRLRGGSIVAQGTAQDVLADELKRLRALLGNR